MIQFPRSAMIMVGLMACVPVGRTSGAEGAFHPVALQSRIARVQPMTGIVVWADSEHTALDAIQLEYSYCRYSDIVRERGTYDWKKIDGLLDAIAARKHQAILRFYDTYPGQQTTVPDYIKKRPDYKETQGKSEKQDTGFPDWSHMEWKRFVLEFYAQFAERYDRDRRRVPHLRRTARPGPHVPRQGLPDTVPAALGQGLPRDAVDDLHRRRR
jgi:hypothetical protein